MNEFYKQKLAEGKPKKQAIVCVMEMLVNIMYNIIGATLIERQASRYNGGNWENRLPSS
jgi:hypothetical protein